MLGCNGQAKLNTKHMRQKKRVDIPDREKNEICAILFHTSAEDSLDLYSENMIHLFHRTLSRFFIYFNLILCSILATATATKSS